MPVDRDLAAESLKSVDQKVYEMYVKLRDEGMTEREIGVNQAMIQFFKEL